MMLIYIVLVSLLIAVILLLFMPLRLVINTISGSYYLQLKGLLRASLLTDDQEILKIRLSNWLFQHDLYPLKYKTRKKEAPSKKVSNSRSNHSGLKTLGKVRRVIGSFQVKRFYLNIDSGDVILNSKLFPAFALLRFYNANVHVNFTGKNSLILIVENRPIRLIRSFINI